MPALPHGYLFILMRRLGDLFSILNVLLHLWLYSHSSIHIVLFHVTLNFAKMFEFYEKNPLGMRISMSQAM